MTRLWMAGLHLAELFVSSLVHLLYGLYIFSTAVAGDLSQALNESLFKSNVNVGVKEEEPKGSTSAADLPPIVLVHGIFGFGKGRLGGLSYFAGAEKKDERVFVPDLGSLTSIYDRACELFYYLKGGQVDYGEEHSKACGHSRFGRIYEQGHYPEWDEDHPIHFVGHSAGAQVVRVLQQMLADKAFSGHENTSENWVLSVTSLSGAFNGTTRTYLDGMQPEDGRSLKPISLLQLCRLGVRVYDWLDVPWLKNYYNFGFDHFNMSWKKRGVRGFVDCLLGNSGPFASGDWILPDLTIQGSMRLNSHLQTFPNTYYFSYATKRTRKIMGVTVPSSIPGIHPLLFLRVLQMSQWRLPQDTKPPYKGYRDEDWWDNDGALNTISMTHPRLPVEHPSQLVVKDSDCQPMQPGIWGVIGGDDTNQDYVVGEEEAVWLVKMILPYLNEFLLKFRALFYGDPATTMKLAIMLFVLARFGSTITIWKMAKLGFFGVFSLPKICSSYSTLITAYDEKFGSDKDAATNISRDVSRRDMATQISPEGSPYSSPKRLSFSPSTPPVLPIVELESPKTSKLEVRDIQVDEQVTMTRWSKKHRA